MRPHQRQIQKPSFPIRPKFLLHPRIKGAIEHRKGPLRTISQRKPIEIERMHPMKARLFIQVDTLRKYPSFIDILDKSMIKIRIARTRHNKIHPLYIRPLKIKIFIDDARPFSFIALRDPLSLSSPSDNEHVSFFPIERSDHTRNSSMTSLNAWIVTSISFFVSAEEINIASN